MRCTICTALQKRGSKLLKLIAEPAERGPELNVSCSPIIPLRTTLDRRVRRLWIQRRVNQ
jgi:hypothetical protein